MKPADSFCLLFCTIDSQDRGRDIARALVESELAACVNLIPKIQSIYRWKGEVCSDEEQLLIMKIRRSAVEGVQARIKELHPYDVPEIITLRLDEASAPYLQWLEDNTSSSTLSPSA